MSLDRIMLIVVCVIGAIGLSTWTFGAFFAAREVHPAIGVLIFAFVAFVFYFIWRLLAERLNNPDEDHYDNMDN